MPDCKPTLSSELGLELLNVIKDELKAEIIGISEAINTESENALNELAMLYKRVQKEFL